MNIDNAQLAAFAAVLREGSFEAAARRLCITPSAISQRVRLLEERLGQVLLLRTSPCQATTAGKSLARFAEELSVLEAEMMDEVGAMSDQGAGRLRMPIVVNADSLDSWFMNVLTDPELDGVISFDIRMEDQDHSAALLRDGTVMAAISAVSDAVQGCLVEPLGTMRYRAVASPAFTRQHFAAGVTEESLEKTPMLVFNRKDALQYRFIAQFTAKEIVPPTHYLPSSYGFLEAARRGLAWGMCPQNFVYSALASGELIDISPGKSLDVALYWHRWRLKSNALALLGAAVHRAATAALLKV